MKHKLQTLLSRRSALPLLCYALAVLLWLARGVYGCVADTGLPGWQTAVGDLHLIDLAPVPDTGGRGFYTTTSDDPQIVLEDATGLRVRTVSYVPDFADGEPREMCLYYTNAAGEPFSREKRVFPTVTAGGRYVYTLPRAHFASLRIDPCSPADGQALTVCFQQDSIDFNAPETLPQNVDHFVPTWYELFCLLLYPALAAAALDWLRACAASAKAALAQKG